MHTDELRAELAELAREVDEFPEELPTIRRRVARRRMGQASVAAVLVVGLIVGVIATRSGGDHVRVAGHPKEAAIEDVPRIDALVALPGAATTADINAVNGILDSTGVVKSYARLPKTFASLWSRANELVTAEVRAFARRSLRSVVLSVELDRNAADAMMQLRAAVGSTATVDDFGEMSDRERNNDVEVFMRVQACSAQIDAVRVAAERDPAVDSFRFVSKADALERFRRIFVDEPALLKDVTADALPTSFQFRVRDGAAPSEVATRYERLSGVQATNVRANPFVHETPFVPSNDDSSTCAPNP
jgi:hypothetical protein